MVEYKLSLDSIFTSLADPTRREILMRVSQNELSISELAKPHNMSFAAIAKHISMLEAAHLIRKRRVGKQQLVSMSVQTVQKAKKELEKYEKLWNKRFSQLDELLK